MVQLGMTNSRMKDFFDVWSLARGFAFEGKKLAEAIQATFRRRDTELPDETPVALSRGFALDPIKRTQWNAFLNKSNVRERIVLDEILNLLRDFLLPPMRANAGKQTFKMHWKPPGPWQT